MSDQVVVLGFRVPFARGTLGKAAEIEREAWRLGAAARSFVVGSDRIELWVHDSTPELLTHLEQLKIKGVVFHGPVLLEDSQAERAAAGWRALAWNRALRQPRGLSRESVEVDRWWSVTQ